MSEEGRAMADEAGLDLDAMLDQWGQLWAVAGYQIGYHEVHALVAEVRQLRAEWDNIAQGVGRDGVAFRRALRDVLCRQGGIRSNPGWSEADIVDAVRQVAERATAAEAAHAALWAVAEAAERVRAEVPIAWQSMRALDARLAALPPRPPGAL